MTARRWTSAAAVAVALALVATGAPATVAVPHLPARYATTSAGGGAGGDPSAVEATVEVTPAAPPAPGTARTFGSDEARATGDDVVTATSDVSGFATVGVTWSGRADADLDVAARTSDDGGATWSAWGPMEVEAPDPGAPEGGSAPLVVGEVDRVEVAVGNVAAEDVRDVELVVVDPGRGAVDRAAADPSLDDDGALSPFGKGAGGVVRLPGAVATGDQHDGPAVRSRADWGADESLMTWTPRQGQVEGAIIHHTAGTNSYTSSQVPSIIRGIYTYHAKTRGWGDIGYNFLVDRWGRIWEGRTGGVELEIVGAHAVGVNDETVGVSVLGNYEQATVSDAAVRGVIDLLAWKLALHGVPARGYTTLDGSREARISGHRDVGSTACPGASISRRMTEIRSKVAHDQARWGHLWNKSTGYLVEYRPHATRDEVWFVSGSTRHLLTSTRARAALAKRLGRASYASRTFLTSLERGTDFDSRWARVPSGRYVMLDGNGDLMWATACGTVRHWGGDCTDPRIPDRAKDAFDVEPISFFARSDRTGYLYRIHEGRRERVYTRDAWWRLTRAVGWSELRDVKVTSALLNEFPAGPSHR
ncbi:N-acetylmuramoyl-L-alanine amidase [Isoptericola sp. QY 916]|uniref:peptidoglycan recognition protein family protein n=1 Tax=Isoptericola sp. QY 916 TaxID=2782570 RepID=UPI003D2FA5FB|nr:N-acetylmuramoyl-L-alanine amidase [Isoptericola sp. QY 916]